MTAGCGDQALQNGSDALRHDRQQEKDEEREVVRHSVSSKNNNGRGIQNAADAENDKSVNSAVC